MCREGGGAIDLARRLGVSLPERPAPTPISRARQNGATPKHHRRTVAAYSYRDASGAVLFRVVRTDPKAFYQQRPDGRGCWINGLGGTEPVLYHLPEIIVAPPDATVHVGEGEKDADRLQSLGLLATTAPMGAGKWRPAYTDILAGRDVVIFEDNDEPGRRHAREVAEQLNAAGCTVRVVALPELPEKGDVSDWLDGGYTRNDLIDRISRTPLWQPGAPTVAESSPELGVTRAIVRSLAEVEPRTVEALWPGYLVRHKLNLIAGYGGVGKGQVMANLIARLSRGDPMPGQTAGVVARTLILAAEDDPHEDIRPRLDANRANLDHILILDGVDEGDGEARWVDIQQHIALISATVREHSIDLVYIDPLASYMPGVRRHDGGQVRDALNHLQRLINDTGVTVIAALHLGKEATNRRGAMKILDSVEYVNIARNVIGVNDLPDEYQPDDVLDDAGLGRRKVLAVLKSNSMIPGPPLVWSRAKDAEVTWHGTSPVAFDETFASAPPETAREAARDWLVDFLKGGMQPERRVEAESRAAGVSLRTLKRAKKDLGVTSHKDGRGAWYWRLPDGPAGGQDATGGDAAGDDRASGSQTSGANEGGHPTPVAPLAPLAPFESIESRNGENSAHQEGSQGDQEGQLAPLDRDRGEAGQGGQEGQVREVASFAPVRRSAQGDESARLTVTRDDVLDAIWEEVP